MRSLFLSFVAICTLPLSASAHAQSIPAGFSEQGFQAYLPYLRGQALASGVGQATIDRVFPTLQFSPRTVELDRAQMATPGGPTTIPPFEPYRRKHVSPNLISRGSQRYAGYRAQLDWIGRRYGVTPSVVVAIWGHETSYGAVTGDFDLLNSLASLSYEGRRRKLFTDEFIATLKLVDRGFPRSLLKGSYAGATGHPQFLPSVYLRVAADGDGDGRPNIWNSPLDGLASIANYLRNAGWKPGVRWGVRVSVPDGLDRASLRTTLRSPRCPRTYERHTKWLTVREWKQLGLVAAGGAWPADDELASLLEPDGRGSPAYLLTNNYRAILDYNCSNFYALSVGLLADEIAR